MQLSIKNLLLLAISTSALVIERDAATTKKDLATINADTITFTDKVNNYIGGFTVLEVNAAQNQLTDDIKAATTNAQNGGAVTSAEAQQIMDYINGALEPNVAKSITALKNKKAQFEKDGFKQVALDGLKTTKTNNQALGDALLKNTPSDKKSAAQAGQAKFNADFDSGIAAFSS
ncbi:Putative Cell wall mannoprotein [Septoria linicola]|uniref:Cell wall mannoprotein n=1 Tax=Septoria linicola TaxID=215465 RepID=A0A9Q9B6U3_9PEZI|nr:Putative Cell wall mannoprotein [Septoria linicola]